MPRPVPLDLLNAMVSLHGLTVTRGLSYGPDPRHALDLITPEGARGRPTLVWFYGGGWKAGERAHYRFAAAALARCGYMVAVPDYRLYPAVRYPEFLADAAAAVAHVQRIAAGPVVLIGHSAGAYIAAMLALDPRWLGEQRRSLAGMIGLSGPYDFMPLETSGAAAIFAGPADPRETQPINQVGQGHPPLLLLHGERDRTCYPRHSLALAMRARAHGGAAEARLFPRLGHSGMLLQLAPWQRGRSGVLAEIRRFVEGASVLAPIAGRSIQPAQ